MDLGHRVSRVVSPQPIEDGASFPVHCSLVDKKFSGDLFVTAPAGDQLHYLHLAWGQERRQMIFPQLGQLADLAAGHWGLRRQLAQIPWSPDIPMSMPEHVPFDHQGPSGRSGFNRPTFPF